MTSIADRSSTLTPIGGDINALIKKLRSSDSENARKVGERLKELQQLPQEVIDARRAAREAEEDKFVQRARYEVLMNNSRLVGIDRSRTLASYKPITKTGRTMKDLLMESLGLWPEEKRSFYIWGPDNGPGKSHCAKGFLLGLIQKNVDVRFWRMTDLRAAMIRSYKDPELLNPAEEGVNIDYFAVDDWDKAGINPEKSAGIFSDLYSLFDYRSDQNLPVIMTGQLPLRKQSGYASSLEESWGKDLTDRLSHCIQIYVTGPSGRAGLPKE